MTVEKVDVRRGSIFDASKAGIKEAFGEGPRSLRHGRQVREETTLKLVEQRIPGLKIKLVKEEGGEPYDTVDLKTSTSLGLLQTIEHVFDNEVAQSYREDEGEALSALEGLLEEENLDELIKARLGIKPDQKLSGLALVEGFEDNLPVLQAAGVTQARLKDLKGMGLRLGGRGMREVGKKKSGDEILTKLMVSLMKAMKGEEAQGIFYANMTKRMRGDMLRRGVLLHEPINPSVLSPDQVIMFVNFVRTGQLPELPKE